MSGRASGRVNWMSKRLKGRRECKTTRANDFEEDILSCWLIYYFSSVVGRREQSKHPAPMIYNAINTVLYLMEISFYP